MMTHAPGWQAMAIVWLIAFAPLSVIALVTLPMAVYRHDLRYWFRETGVMLYMAAFGLACVALRSLAP